MPWAPAYGCPSQHEAVADSRAHGQVNEAIVASSCAVQGLAQRGRADVCLDNSGCKLRKFSPHRQPSPGDGLCARDLAVGRHELGDARSDALHHVAHRRGLPDEVGSKIKRVLKHLMPMSTRACRNHTARQHFGARKEHETAGRFGSTDVQADSTRCDWSLLSGDRIVGRRVFHCARFS